jgi:hypothetical protein|tara:strand:- start:986 stop:2248 length:1263 start_codon:yes stop_codon:yes gene_type:complete
MATNKKQVSEKIFNLLKGFGYEVKTFDVEGNNQVNPQESTRFVVEEPNILVRLDLNKNSIILNTSEDLTDHKIRPMLKELSKDYLLNFDYNVFGKRLKPKGELQDAEKNSEKDMADVMEASLGKLSGSTKTSYQPLENVKIVLKHKKAIDEEIRGSRSRNIHSIFIQRGEERFKLPENNLAMARAMARHVQKGGEVFDEIGESIVNMARDLSKLREFIVYVKRSNIVNEANAEYVNLAIENINNIRETFKKLQGAKTYATAVESLSNQEKYNLEEDDSDIQSLFTETHFDDKVANVIDNLRTLNLRKKAFESHIMNAIENEQFNNAVDMLKETELLQFDTPNAKLGHQVSQLGFSAKDERLGNYLRDCGKRLSSGGQMSDFDYRAIKSSLLSAGDRPVKGEPMSYMESYEKFLDRFSVEF